MGSHRLKLAKKRKLYVVHSSFLTVQGEGAHAGRRAVFLRFSGCNVWDGQERHRSRDAQSGSACAAICDTDFHGIDGGNGGGSFSSADLVSICRELWGFEGRMFIVFTGGEPSLQVDEELVRAFKAERWQGPASRRGSFLAVETNGFKQLPRDIDWVTLSPKPPSPITEQHYSELKLLSIYIDLAADYERFAQMRWIQPTDFGPDALPGTNQNAIDISVRFVHTSVGWGISCQGHKMLGIE